MSLPKKIEADYLASLNNDNATLFDNIVFFQPSLEINLTSSSILNSGNDLHDHFSFYFDDNDNDDDASMTNFQNTSSNDADDDQLPILTTNFPTPSPTSTFFPTPSPTNTLSDYSPSYTNNNQTTFNNDPPISTNFPSMSSNSDNQTITAFPTLSPTTLSPTSDYYSSYNNQILTELVVFILFGFTAFVCVIKLVMSINDPPQTNYIIHGRTITDNNNDNDLPRLARTRLSRRQRALRSKVIKALFPKATFNDESKLKSDDGDDAGNSGRVDNTTCSICLENFQEGDVILSGHCSHIFHRECVMVWVKQHDSCPVCRQPIFDEAAYKAIENQIIHLDV